MMSETLSAKQARFSLLCDREYVAAAPTGINTYGEKRLHALLKDFYCPDRTRQEIRLSDEYLTGDHMALTDAALRRARDRYIADILREDGHIIEIQTGGFYPLVKKLHFYLCATRCRVTVVHPIAAVKWVRWMDAQTGELTDRRRSPKRGKPTDIARELYWLLPYLAEQRFSLCLPLLEIEETRLQDGWGKDGKRGSHRYDRTPLSLCDEVVLRCPQDYAALFLPPPDHLIAPFTAAEYGRAAGLRGKPCYSMLHMLCELGFVTPCEQKRGRAGQWERIENAKK